MKFIFTLGVLSMSIFGNTLEIGKLAPNFTLEDQDGNRRMLNDYRGKKVVIYFFQKQIHPDDENKPAVCGITLKITKS